MRWELCFLSAGFFLWAGKEKRGGKAMKTYWFKDEKTGEEFFVEQENKEKAFEVAKNFFGDEIKCFGRISEQEAEFYGYDTY